MIIAARVAGVNPVVWRSVVGASGSYAGVDDREERTVPRRGRAGSNGAHPPWRGLLVLSIGVLLLIASALGARAETTDAVHVITIDDEIDLSTAPYLDRALQAAADDDAALAVLVLDTPGGRLDAVLQLRELLLDTDVPTVAFVNRDALSAGALVAIASDEIVFAPGGVLGAAEPVVLASGGAQTADAKVVATVTGTFRATADARGRDPEVAAAMVDVEVVVDDLVDDARLVALDAGQAERVGYLDARADDLDQLLADRGLDRSAVVEQQPRPTERAVDVITHPAVGAVLLALGVVLLVGEVFLGAFGLVSATGVAALGVFFYGHVLAGLAGWQETLVILIGIGLIMLEILVVPGFGVPGVLGLSAVLGGGWLTIVGTDLDLVTTGQMISTGATVLIAFVAITIGLIALLSLASRASKDERGASGADNRTPRWLRWFGDGDRLARDEGPTGPEDDGAIDDGAPLSAAADSASRQGAIGVAASDLRPAGIAEFDGYRVDVVTLGDYLEKGEPVEVVKAERYRRVVRRARG